MVHWLDQLSASDRSAMLARLDRLPADARERVLAVESVDGAPVVVTRMILDFDSFGKWLDKVVPTTQAPPPAPPSGGFTDIFVASGAQRGSPVAEIDSPTVSWTPPKPPEPKSEPKPHAPAISVRFREPGSGPKQPSAAPPPPPKPAPLPPAPKPAAPGEFTRIFGATHLEPEPPPPAAQPQFMPPPPPASPMTGTPMSGASATSALERVVAPPPRPAAPPPPPPSPSSPWSGPPPVVPLPSPSASATPMPGANINLPPAASVMPAQPVQSDFTRIIGAAGPAPSVAPPPPPAAPPPAPTPPPASALGKKILPALLAFGALALAALVMVVMALIRRK